jgi:hypothetical protein
MQELTTLVSIQQRNIGKYDGHLGHTKIACIAELQASAMCVNIANHSFQNVSCCHSPA